MSEPDSITTVLEMRVGKARPTRNLPTDRVSRDSQLLVLRAYAKASDEQARAAVSNADVARFATIGASSVSLCNPFFNEAGLLVREGLKQRPVDAVFAYDQAVEWGADAPGSKLAPVLANSWFGKALLAKLSLKPISRNEALVFLADECRAAADYRSQIDQLIDYLELADLIVVDGNMVSKAQQAGQSLQAAHDEGGGQVSPLAGSLEVPLTAQRPSQEIGASSATRRIAIALPNHEQVLIVIPEAFEMDDWVMVAEQLATYIRRWKKWKPTKSLIDAINDDENPEDLA